MDTHVYQFSLVAQIIVLDAEKQSQQLNATYGNSKDRSYSNSRNNLSTEMILS